jgi:hypothetical protein
VGGFLATRLEASDTIVHDETYEFAGYGFRLLSDVEAVDGLLRELLEPYKATLSRDVPTYSALRAPGTGDRLTFHLDGECLLNEKQASPRFLIDYFISDLTRKSIQLQSDFIALHASVASWMGRGIIMPAAPDSGKTTTVAGLVRAGFDYLSDEAAFINPQTGWVHPFHRPLAMGTRSVGAIDGLGDDLPDEYHELMRRQQYHVPCEYIRENSRGAPCPINFVVSPSYTRGSATSLEPMSRAEALILFVEQTFGFKDLAFEALPLFGEILRGADCYRLRIGDLSGAVAVIKELFESGR